MMAVRYGAEREEINGEHRRQKCGIRSRERVTPA